MQAVGERVAGVGFAYDGEGSLVIGREPYPSRAEERYGGLSHVLAQRVRVAECGVYGLEQRPRGHALRCGRERGEIEVVVPCLRGVVEEGTVGLTDNLLERHAFVEGAGDELVELGDIGGRVLVVMVEQRLLRDVGCERLHVVRQRRQTELFSCSGVCHDRNFISEKVLNNRQVYCKYNTFSREKPIKQNLTDALCKVR